MVWPCGTKIFGRKNRPKNRHFSGSFFRLRRWLWAWPSKVALFSRKMAPWDIYTRIPGRIFKNIPKFDNPSIWYGPVVRNFWPKKSVKSTKKSSFLYGGHGDKKLHFFTKNGRNVTWMGSNGYIMHITYLNYVDISPAEPKKSIFRVCKTVKMTKIGKMTIFWWKYFSQKIEFYY